MKLVVCLLVAALSSMAAADITITVRNDAGTVVSTTILTTNNNVLTALNQWRQANIETYPTVDALWRKIIAGFVKDNVLPDWHAQIVEQRRLIDVAAAEIERLKALAVQ